MKKYLFLALYATILCSCEKAILQEDANNVVVGDGNVVLKFSPRQTNITRAATAVSDVCSRLNIGVFDMEDTSIKTIAQKATDTGFGATAITLAEGNYKIVGLGHNKENSVAANSTTDITFSGGPSDVFLYYGTIEVTEKPKTYDLTMQRVVGMFRLTLTDESIPEGVAKLEIAIAGGSIHINPSTGSGGTNKTPQKTTIDIAEGQKVFEVYTFPQEGGNTVNVTITAKSADGTEIAKKVISDLPIKANEVTACTGKLFDGVSAITSSSLGFSLDPNWGETNSYEF